MSLVGRLEDLALPDIFQIISLSKKTGTLVVRSRKGTGMVVFKDGQVIQAASDSIRDSLGNILVSQGMLTEPALAHALSRQKREIDKPLGMILVEMGVVSGADARERCPQTDRGDHLRPSCVGGRVFQFRARRDRAEGQDRDRHPGVPPQVGHQRRISADGRHADPRRTPQRQQAIAPSPAPKATRLLLRRQNRNHIAGACCGSSSVPVLSACAWKLRTSQGRVPNPH